MPIEVVTTHNWLKANKLTLNFMVFANLTHTINSVVHDVEIEKVSTFKYLGLMLDHLLDFSAHTGKNLGRNWEQ